MSRVDVGCSNESTTRPVLIRLLLIVVALIRVGWAGMWWIAPASLFVTFDTLIELQFPDVGDER